MWSQVPTCYGIVMGTVPPFLNIAHSFVVGTLETIVKTVLNVKILVSIEQSRHTCVACFRGINFLVEGGLQHMTDCYVTLLVNPESRNNCFV